MNKGGRGSKGRGWYKVVLQVCILREGRGGSEGVKRGGEGGIRDGGRVYKGLRG